ncbi:hypothetical protein PHAVU_003G032600, partial [Phaseolus vulgaris]
HHKEAIFYFQGYEHLDLTKKHNQICKTIWIAFVWTIWNHKNDIIFRNKISDGIQIFALIQINSWAWITFRHPKVIFSYSDWCLPPIMCINSL